MQGSKKQVTMEIFPEKKYEISGAALMTIMSVLENTLPCRYIGVYEQVSSIVASVRESGAQLAQGTQPLEQDAGQGVGGVL